MLANRRKWFCRPCLICVMWLKRLPLQALAYWTLLTALGLKGGQKIERHVGSSSSLGHVTVMWLLG